MCLAKMSICNLSDLSSSFSKNTSSHDSHTEVHQPSSIRKSMTSHHTSSCHHLYEGDLVFKTSNLNESSISSNWGLGFSGRGGGEKRKCSWNSTTNSFFSHPPFIFRSPPPGEAQAQAQLLEIEDRLRLEVLETRSPHSRGDDLMLYDVMSWTF